MPQLVTMPSAIQQEPAPAPDSSFIRTIALSAVEALQGMRPLEQLSRYVTLEVFEQLSMQRTLRRDRQAIYRDYRRVVPMPGKVVRSMPNAWKVHGVVVMHTGPRSFAVVLMFELLDSRWRASQLVVL